MMTSEFDITDARVLIQAVIFYVPLLVVLIALLKRGWPRLRWLAVLLAAVVVGGTVSYSAFVLREGDGIAGLPLAFWAGSLLVLAVVYVYVKLGRAEKEGRSGNAVMAGALGATLGFIVIRRLGVSTAAGIAGVLAGISWLLAIRIVIRGRYKEPIATG